MIGGGPAGSVVSKLLSDDPWRKVLLIEAGGASQVELGGKVRIELRCYVMNGFAFMSWDVWCLVSKLLRGTRC